MPEWGKFYHLADAHFYQYSFGAALESLPPVSSIFSQFHLCAKFTTAHTARTYMNVALSNRVFFALTMARGFSVTGPFHVYLSLGVLEIMRVNIIQWKN